MAAYVNCTNFLISELPKSSKIITSSISTLIKNQNPEDPSPNLKFSRSILNHQQKIRKKPFKKLAKDDDLIKQTCFISSLVENGNLKDALQLFDKMPKRDTFVWNVIIRGLVDMGWYNLSICYYNKMQFDGINGDHLTYPFVIKACSWLLSVDEAKQVHAKAIKSGLSEDLYICNALIAMYSKLGYMNHSESLFKRMIVKDLVTWNSMISGYVSNGNEYNAMMYFRDLQSFGMIPDRFSFVSALIACSIGYFIEMGMEIHCQVIKFGFELDVMVQTTLIDMYCKCRDIEYAERCFSGIVQRNIGAWNAMIHGYTHNNSSHKAFMCLKTMQEDDNLVPDEITLVNILSACAQTRALLMGESVHGFAIRKGFSSQIILETALLDMYGKCGKLNLADFLFNQMNSKTLISWNVMIAAYVQNESHKEGLQLFKTFLKANLEPDAVTIASILPAYAELASLREGEQIHGYVAKSCHAYNAHVLNAIIYMYAKCGDLISARKLFNTTITFTDQYGLTEVGSREMSNTGLVNYDVVSWNTIIMAYALHGLGNDAMELFKSMLEHNIQPNGSTFVSLLSACSISGMVEEGWKYFNLMKMNYGIDHDIEHYGCMVDLLGREGHLDTALQFIRNMPLVPTPRIWGSLLKASRHRKNIEMAELAAEHILSINQDNTGCYVLLSNMYASLRRWEDVEKIKNIMKKEGLERTVGVSTVEISGKINSFVNHDQSHEDINKIYDALTVISTKIEDNLKVNDLMKFRPSALAKKRAKSPAVHSVRLAITYGLISTSVGKPIVVRKNIRLCENCHAAAKKVSECTGREIIVGESKIFHRFKDGKCSCGDYW